MRFVSKEGKSYGTKEEFQFRSDVFKNNLEKIVKENSKNDNSFHVAINKFADWTPAEYKRLLGYKAGPSGPVVELSTENLGDAIDW